MKSIFFYHRHANLLVENDSDFQLDYKELISVINSISDQDLIENLIKEKVKDKTLKVYLNQ